MDAHDRDVRREGLTMALCVSITLLAALSLVAGEHTTHLDVLAIVWGTTGGLAVAHGFAFSLAGRPLDPTAEDPRNDGSTKARALGVAAIVLVLGLVVAGIKHALGH